MAKKNNYIPERCFICGMELGEDAVDCNHCKLFFAKRDNSEFGDGLLKLKKMELEWSRIDGKYRLDLITGLERVALEDAVDKEESYTIMKMAEAKGILKPSRN